MQNISSVFKEWISNQLGSTAYSLEPLKGDASFRSYYRVKTGDRSYIVMFAPPTQEKTDAFVAIAKAWKHYGLLVPTVWGWEQEQGFVLLSDFGDVLLLDVLDPSTADKSYCEAMQSLLLLQRTNSAEYSLPHFDEAYIGLELSYFQEWFLEKLLGYQFSKENLNLWQDLKSKLVHSMREQPQVTIHRDYHSRNLMLKPEGGLGIIDFQDAMIGPMTYDLVSLLKDCYIHWPVEKVLGWATDFYHMLHQEKQLVQTDLALFLKWFDWAGLQRHLKVLGIFSRLNLRDGKPHYMKDFPRIMQYVLQVTEKYQEFNEFHQWLLAEVTPSLEQRFSQEINFKTSQKVA